MLKCEINGTINELEQIWPWQTICDLIHIDYYNRYLIPADERFTITEKDLARLEIIKGEED